MPSGPMMVWRILATAAAMCLIGCAVPPAPAPTARGNNRIDGQAWVAVTGAPVMTCAGAHVGLYPATAPVMERIRAIYGGGETGYVRVADYAAAGPPPAFGQALHQTRCDRDGRFQFDGLADGDYVVTTNVVWRHKYVTYGGGLMHVVRLHGGIVRQITLSNRTAPG